LILNVLFVARLLYIFFIFKFQFNLS